MPLDPRRGAGLLQRLRDLPTWIQDVLLVAVVLVVQFVALATSGPDRAPVGQSVRAIDLGAYLLVVAATLPLLVRRRVPALALAVPILALLVFAALEYGGVFSGYAILVGLYSIVVHRGLRQGVIGAVVTFVVLLIAYRLSPWTPNAADNVFDLLAIATAVALGDGTRTRVALARQQAARLEVLVAEQERIARQTVLEERARIARELHDLVAHAMSIVAVQAGVGHHLIDRDPAKAKDALATIETTSRQALTEMRRMLGVLRTDDEAAVRRDPQPTTNDLAELVEQARTHGLDVDLTVEGDPGRVPSGVALSGYRIVQEALTNVRKHAGPATVRVRVCHDADRMTITVDDDGRGMSTLASSTPGFGLVGMRERAAVVGGELTTGPRPGGGFRVHATLPYATPGPEGAAARAADRTTDVARSTT